MSIVNRQFTHIIINMKSAQMLNVSVHFTTACCHHCDNVEQDARQKKRRGRTDLTGPTDHRYVSVGKRKASADARAPAKTARRSDSSVVSETKPLVERKRRRATDDGEAPKKKQQRCSDGSTTSRVVVKQDVLSDEDGGVSQSVSSASSEEETIYEMSSLANTSGGELIRNYFESFSFLSRSGIKSGFVQT